MSSTGLNIQLKCVAKDANGNVIGTSEKEYDVALDNFADLMAVSMLAGTAATYKPKLETTGVATALDMPVTAYAVLAGSGLGAVARTDYKLATAIAGGSGTGGSLSLNGGVTITGGTFTITGFFTNSSGGALTYGEIGIQITDTTPNNFLITHDQTNGGTGFSVPNNGTLDFAYTFTYS